MKLTAKLILAFLTVGLLSVGILALFTRFVTDREFNKFVDEQYKTGLSEQLGSYFEENGTWEGVEDAFHFMPMRGPMRRGGHGQTSFSIADVKGNILVADYDRQVGDVAAGDEIENGTPIYANDQLVGILLIEDQFIENPLEKEFLGRINRLVFISAAGSIFFALILGAILSRAITRPVRELTSATRKMADGKLGQQVPVRSNDEIGELAVSFNKMNDALSRSSDLRKQMTADIAHELRTPLSLIIGHAEGVHDGVLEPSLETFEIIREEAERLEKLVNDLRTLSLADAGELSLEFQPTDVNSLIRDIHAHYINLFNQQRVSLDLNLFPGILQKTLDPNRFAQIVRNILDNALHHTPQDGSVTIETSVENEKVRVSIQDSGPGLDPEDAGRIFDRFYRADQARNRNDGGSGLGLAIAKSIVEMHKGKIWAEGEKGKGLKVIVEI